MHMLDCQPVHQTRSVCWSAGGNALYGTVPSSWASIGNVNSLYSTLHYSQRLTVCWYLLSRIFCNPNFVAQSRVCCLAPLELYCEHSGLPGITATLPIADKKTSDLATGRQNFAVLYVLSYMQTLFDWIVNASCPCICRHQAS